MTNQEEALQILNETDRLGVLRVGSLGESVAISCIVRALDEKDAKFKEYLEKKREEFKGEIDKCSFNSFTEYFIAKKMELLDEIINELNKEK